MPLRPVQAAVFFLTAESSSSLTPDPLRHIWGVSSLGLLGIDGNHAVGGGRGRGGACVHGGASSGWQRMSPSTYVSSYLAFFHLTRRV